MVITRSVRSRLESEGEIMESGSNMYNIPRSTEETLVSTAALVVSAPTAGTTTTTMATITPAVQQFMSLAQDRTSFSNETCISNNTITSPEYSSITARNVQQDFRQGTTAASAPKPASNVGSGEEVLRTIQGEFTRKMHELQQQMQQEISRALERVSANQVNPTGVNQILPTQHREGINALPQISYPPQPPRTQENGLGNNFSQQQPQNYIPQQYFQQPYNFQPTPVNAARSQQQAVGSQPAPALAAHSSPIPTMPPEFGFPLRKIDLSKWGIKFDGTTKSMSAEDFIFRVDVLRQDYNCSFNDIRRSFHLLLEGPALDWYWNVRKLTSIQSWEDLERAFLTQYRRYENEFQLQKKIMDRRQLPQEAFEEFYNAVMRLRNQQRSPYTERDLIEIMKANLKPSLAQLLFAVKINNLNDFCQQAKRAENLVSSQRQPFQPRPFANQRVHELEFEEEELPVTNVEIDAITPNSRYTCWNCKQVGHSFMDCPSPTRRIFCFRCGRDNVVTPKCPKCQGNSQLNQPRTGETRSTQT